MADPGMPGWVWRSFEESSGHDGGIVMARILIAEDDRDFCESLTRYLSALGHTPICEGDGRSALKSLMREDPDMILLDLKLPIMDGYAFLKVLRSYVRFRFLPVFIMTGVTDENFLRDVEGAGVTQIFRKGLFEFADMRRAIEAAVQKYKDAQ